MKLSSQSFFFTVDGTIPGRLMLDSFTFSNCRLRKSTASVSRRSRHLVVEMVAFDRPHNAIDAFETITRNGRYGFLSGYDLLVFDWKHPWMQMDFQIVTPEYTLGIDPDDIPECLDRKYFKKVISDTSMDLMMKATARYPTILRTDVDRIDLDAPIEESDYYTAAERLLRLQLTHKLMSGGA